MDFDNKTILITGLIICSMIALIFKNHDVSLAIVSGLVGYLSKDNVSVDKFMSQLTNDTLPVDDEE